MSSPIVPLKQCALCKQEFPATSENFYQDKRGRNGLAPRCKKCTNRYLNAWKAQNKEKDRDYKRRYIANNPDKVQTSKQHWFDRNPEYKKQHYERHKKEYRVRAKTRYQQQRTKRLIQARRYYRMNVNRIKDRTRQYRHTHIPNVLCAKCCIHRRMARKRGLPNIFSDTDWKRALDYFKDCCAVCGHPRGLWHTLAADHWIPLSASNCPGTVPTNIVPLCHGVDGCNNSKGKKQPMEWLNEKLGSRRAQTILKKIEAYFSWIKGVLGNE